MGIKYRLKILFFVSKLILQQREKKVGLGFILFLFSSHYSLYFEEKNVYIIGPLSNQILKLILECGIIFWGTFKHGLKYTCCRLINYVPGWEEAKAV